MKVCATHTTGVLAAGIMISPVIAGIILASVG